MKASELISLLLICLLFPCRCCAPKSHRILTLYCDFLSLCLNLRARSNIINFSPTKLLPIVVRVSHRKFR